MIMETNLTVQVHVLNPNENLKYTINEENKYRIYVNNHLLTERDWIWPSTTYIEENIWVDIDTNNANHITLEPIFRHKTTTKFFLYNLKVNGKVVETPNEETIKLSF